MAVSAALFGIVDLGTWNIRFSINSVQPHHARILPCVFQDRAPVRLYKGNDVPIAPHEIDNTLVALKRFCSICSDYGVAAENVRIAANPHEAPNFDELVSRIHHELHLEVLRLSQDGEHWANAYGVASSVYDARGLYIELRPTYANLYYLNLSSEGTDGPPEALIGPIKIPYTKSSSFRVHTAEEDGAGEDDLSCFESRLSEASRSLLAQAQSSQMQSDTVFLSGSGFYGLHTLLASMSLHEGPATNGIVLVPQTLADQTQPGRLIRVVQKLGACLVPLKVAKVIYVHHNLRNGLLFQALPPQIRKQDPLLVATRPYALPGVPALAEMLRRALPPQAAAFIRTRLVDAVANAAYIHSSYSSELQSVSALLVAQTGLLASTHGVTLEEKALLGLALSERWGAYFDTTGAESRDRMVRTVSDTSLSCWALYLGMTLHLLGAAYPGAHVRPTSLQVTTRQRQGGDAFDLVLLRRAGSLYGDNIVMDTRIERTQARIAELNGINARLVVEQMDTQ